MSKTSLQTAMFRALMELERGIERNFSDNFRHPEISFDTDHVREAYNLLAEELGVPTLDEDGHIEREVSE